MARADPQRELRAEVLIGASVERVWSVLSDLAQMPEWSPELVRMVPLGRGPVRVGRTYVGINRRGWVLWPTRNVVVTYQPGRALAWDTTSSGARWIYELTGVGEGTHVLHRRPVPSRLTPLSRVFAPLMLGGSASHADELEQGMRATLAGLKAAVER